MPRRCKKSKGPFPKKPSDIEREALQEWGLLPKPEVPEDADWERIDKVLLAHTSLKPWELGQLTVVEACFLVSSLMEKNEAGSDDPKQAQDRMNAAIEEARIYRSLTLDQKLELARREIEG